MGKQTNNISQKTRTVCNYIINYIKENNLIAGDQIPAEVVIAEHMNVSRPTVSKAINLLIEDGLVYKKSGVGTFISNKSTQTEKKKVIGLLFPLIGKGEIFRPITEEITKLSANNNFSLIWGGQFTNSEFNAQHMEQMAEFYIDQKVDGILLAPIELAKESYKINERTIRKIEDANIPIVLSDADYLEYPKRSNHDLVGIDNFRAGYVSAEHYLLQGAKRVDFLSSPDMAQTIPQRIMGYKQALINYGIIPDPNWVHYINDFSKESIDPIINDKAENIICANDNVAMKFIKGLTDIGVNVPHDVRISGFDDLDFAKYLGIPLTTIAQPCADLADVIIYTMLQRIENPSLPIRSIMLDFKLKVRGSSIISKK